MAHEHSGFKNKMSHTSLNSVARAPEQTPNTPIDLSAMIASRICHDLVSPMGAISNGLELLELAQNPHGPELALISQSIDSATARLRFYRIAFGTVYPEQMISRAEVLSVLTAVGQHQKQSFVWDSTATLSRRQVKLVFLLIMCLETALPWGGSIRIRDTEGGLELAAASERMKIEDVLWTPLAQHRPAESISASKIQFAVVVAELAAQNAAISVMEEPCVLRLSVTFS